jgi:hypothetical protein
LPERPGVLVFKKYHLLVRWSQWLTVPILLGLILSGVSIYWASPVCQHKPDLNTGNFDVAADVGVWICAHVPGLHHYSSPPDWIYNHMSLGPGMLALSLHLHFLCAYLFMLNGMAYVAGWSWEEAGAPCCLAGPIWLTRLGCFGTTSAFPSLNS